jgi:hypothetical protein
MISQQTRISKEYAEMREGREEGRKRPDLRKGMTHKSYNSRFNAHP